MATLDDLATFVASACSLTVGTTLFKGQMPATPGACGVIYEYGGMAPETYFGSSTISLEKPRVQVVFRGEPNDYSTPRALAETAFRACGNCENQTLGSTYYRDMTPLQSPFLIRRDENGRPWIGFNVAITKELTA